MYKILGVTTALCIVSSLAMAQTPANSSKPDSAKFNLLPNPKFLSCLSGSSVTPTASVIVTRGDLNDTAVIKVKGLKPDLDFDVFTVQRSSLGIGGAPVQDFKGFGLAWYQSDLHSDEKGEANVRIKTILLDQIFGFDGDAAPAPANLSAGTPAPILLKPTNTFHLGFWFNNPQDAAPCGFDVTKPTPFNGEHRAGPLAMISVPVPPANLGPLCTSPTGIASADDSGSDPNDANKFACNP